MSKQNVMIRDVEDIMIFVDEKVEEIRRSGLPLREMTDRQCYEIGCALDNVFVYNDVDMRLPEAVGHYRVVEV